MMVGRSISLLGYIKFYHLYCIVKLKLKVWIFAISAQYSIPFAIPQKMKWKWRKFRRSRMLQQDVDIRSKPNNYNTTIYPFLSFSSSTLWESSLFWNYRNNCPSQIMTECTTLFDFFNSISIALQSYRLEGWVMYAHQRSTIYTHIDIDSYISNIFPCFALEIHHYFFIAVGSDFWNSLPNSTNRLPPVMDSVEDNIFFTTSTSDELINKRPFCNFVLIFWPSTSSCQLGQ